MPRQAYDPSHPDWRSLESIAYDNEIRRLTILNETENWNEAFGTASSSEKRMARLIFPWIVPDIDWVDYKFSDLMERLDDRQKQIVELMNQFRLRCPGTKPVRKGGN